MNGEISFQQVTKFYEGEQIGVEDLSFSIGKGEFVFLIGKNGSGKSTILRLITGMVLADKGDVMVSNRSINAMDREERLYHRRHLGIMERDFPLMLNRSIYDNLKLVLYASSDKSRFFEEQIDKALSIVGLKDKKKLMAKQLSQGEQAKVMIARAVLSNPHILVLDEPTANLDSTMALDVMRVLEEFTRMGVTVIVASHNSEIVTMMRKRVLVMIAGVLVSDQKHGEYDYKKMDIYEEKKIIEIREKRKL